MKEIFYSCLIWLSARDNVTFLIACTSFVLSLWNCFSSYFQNRRNFSLDIQHMFCGGPVRGGIYSNILDVAISNKSREPIVIARICIFDSEKQVFFGEYSHHLAGIPCTKGTGANCSIPLCSNVLPIKIDGLGCARVLLSSEGTYRFAKDKHLYSAIIFTNKGREHIRFEGELSDLTLLLQCRESGS